MSQCAIAMSFRTISALAIVWVVGCTPPAPQAPTEYLLRIKETPGSKWSYTYKLTTFADPKGMTPANAKKRGIPEYSSADITGTVDMEVKEVKDGKTTFNKVGKTTSAKGTGVWVAQANDLMKAAPDVATYVWNAQCGNANIEKGEFYDPMTNSFHDLFPKEPVKVGSTWKYKPFPEHKDSATAKVLAVEKAHGRDTVKIEIDLPGMPGDKNTMTVWIDPSNGRYLKVDMLSVSNIEGLKSENHMIQDIKT